MTGVYSARDRDRFWAKVSVGAPDDCWEWKASSGHGGYGQFYLGGRLIGAYRAAWLLQRGPIGAGLEVCHRCDNPRCVNVQHLFLGTHAENMRDARDKGRMVLPPTQGGANHAARLTAQDVLAIRGSSLPLSELAHMYGVSVTAISEAQLGKTWRHLPGARTHRAPTGHPGERHPRARLTEEDVRAIRRSTQSHAALARHYKLTPGAIGNIRARRLWKSVV